ncbi:MULTISPECIES: hypothetical protein [Rhodopseudomonas]|uniref:Uncharacterized protein n=1 Tax=Rhodopseudomonas palustris TaxID=1076 RepID=A0A0D7E4B4_RHOPL|nr:MULTISPECIES: hypothetical protein [Rhodopseudomonas]KIZ35371.1 hypothetical protein OO17_25780 [Rhodopseudomonas palustris]MDF3811662.1 hypothetical protein [Rhodopseudomonas sp. BAL398]WOK16333.1 hypothetical protein RBJ75_19515 [Rhodopseudomonas sp. BAL398]
MRPNPVLRLAPNQARQARIHPALRSFADECKDALVRMLAYIGGLALIALVVLFAANPLTKAAVSAATEPMARPGWSQADRSYPAFAVSQFDSPGKIETYEILRHPDGGRKDLLHWAAPDGTPVAELEIYRLGDESRQGDPSGADSAARIDPDGLQTGAAAGLIDSKFGTVALHDIADRVGHAGSCLGFNKSLDANLRLSGWSCQGETVPQRRAAIGCMLDHLVLLSAGNDPKLAEMFAHAELRRGSCAATLAGPGARVDWVTGDQNPQLRGAF